MVVPSELKDLLAEDEMEILKTQQQSLNRRKKLLAKLDRLKKLKQTKCAQWSAYKENLLQTLRQEQEKFETDQTDLQKAIQETQATIDRIMNGDEDEDVEEQDLETLLQDSEKAELTKQLAVAKQENQETQRQLAQLQQQMQAYIATSTVIPVPAEVESTALNELKDEEKRQRQLRIKKVEDQKLRDQHRTDRERSPRRDDSQDINGMT